MADDVAAAEKARAQAEARRKRILEKAQNRMGKVTGDVGQDDTDKKQSASNAARIRAARQRRYGKKSPTASSTTSASVGAEPEQSASSTETTSDDGKQQEQPVPKEDAKATVSKTDTTTTASDSSKPVEEAPKEQEKAKQPEENAPTTTPELVKETDPSGQTEEPKKKYLGVAKMRRKMLKKKKSQAEESVKQDTEETPKASTVNIKSKPTAPTVTIPIYMHFVTILLIFLAGFDVGLQQYHEDVKIHDQLVFKEHGIPLVHGKTWEKSATSRFDSLATEQLLEEPVMEDEFQIDEEDENLGGNIDPLLRVDLDELTKGPGMLNQLARGAVSVHRLLLQLFFYTPISFFQTLIGLPATLLQSPPALCFVALVLRQIVGKKILNAGIPTPEGDEKDSGVDVLALVKQGVTNFLSSAFPTAVGFYDVFSHLRSDMYIALCGVFFGLALTHLSDKLPGGNYEGATTTDEL